MSDMFEKAHSKRKRRDKGRRATDLNRCEGVCCINQKLACQDTDGGMEDMKGYV